MNGMGKVSEAILDNVREEAQSMVREAEEKGKWEIERAKQQREERLEEERRKMIAEAEGETARIRARASIAARQKLLSAKASLIDEIVSQVRKAVSGVSSDESLLNLIREAISGFGADEVKIYVSSRDVDAVKKVLKLDQGLGSRVKEVGKIDCSGGVIVESIDGKIRIDNTYDTRLEMLLPRILPEVSEELFQGQ